MRSSSPLWGKTPTFWLTHILETTTYEQLLIYIWLYSIDALLLQLIWSPWILFTKVVYNMVVSQKEKRESCSLVWVIPFTSFGQMFAPEKITKPFLMSIRSKNNVMWRYTYLSHRFHVWQICLQGWLIFMVNAVNVCIYIYYIYTIHGSYGYDIHHQNISTIHGSVISIYSGPSDQPGVGRTIPNISKTYPYCCWKKSG